MRSLLRLLFLAFGRWLLRLRYRVRVIGLEKLQSLDGPTLVMPNHPAYIDPPLVLMHVPVCGVRCSRWSPRTCTAGRSCGRSSACWGPWKCRNWAN